MIGAMKIFNGSHALTTPLSYKDGLSSRLITNYEDA